MHCKLLVFLTEHEYGIKHPLPRSVRSGIMIDLGGKTYLAGGVTCQGSDIQKQTCQRIDKVHEMQFEDENKPWIAKWVESDLKLSKPKSSHDVLKVPASLCNRMKP